MPRKTTFVTGFAMGYVLGAKAGRSRYEQLARFARGVAENPKVQQTAGSLQSQAAGLAGTVKDKVGASRQGGSGAAGTDSYDVIEMPDTSATGVAPTNGRMGL